MGEDKLPMDEEVNDDEYFNKNKNKIHRSKSVVNINKKMIKKYANKEIVKKKTNFRGRGSLVYQPNNFCDYDSKETKEKAIRKINNNMQDTHFN